MIPRYKVIADYPFSSCKIGDIYTLNLNENSAKYIKDAGGFLNNINLDDYPHLFRKLEWWEGRKEKDFPLFANSNGNYITVRKWVIREGQNDCYAESGGYCHFRATPIDESEYNEYMRKSEKQI